MRGIGLLILAVLAVSSAALADIVYMRDGSVYKGKATRRGEEVLIDVEFATISVPAKDVLRIVADPVASRPASGAATPAETATAAGRAGFRAELATRPEPILFMFMRNLAATPPGPATDDLQRQVEKWQAFTHDRRRKVESEWLAPQDFIRRRQAFAALLNEAGGLLIQARRTGTTTVENRAERRRLQATAFGKLRKAAVTWTDPLLRKFLLGIVEFQAKEFARAEELFRKCCEEAPRIAEFHQGLGLSLVELGRQIDGLAELMEALRLEPDSREAAELVREAMKKVPGYQIKTPTYRQAQELLKDSEPSGGYGGFYSSRSNWLRGKPWQAELTTLPTPAHDRFVFLQAVGAPVGKHALLVDESIVRKARRVLVRIDEKTLAVGIVRQQSYSSARSRRPPLALISVRDYAFSPLTAEKETKFSPGERVTAYSLGIHEEMGTQVRKLPLRIESVAAEGKVKLSGRLAAGETAGPAITDDGRLVGFLAGKTDPMAHGGGLDRLLTLGELAALIKAAEKGAGGFSAPGGSAGAQRKTKPRPAEGRFFIIHVTAGERFEK